MSKSSSGKKNSTTVKVIWLIVLTLLLAAALLFIYFHSDSPLDAPAPSEADPTSANSEAAGEVTEEEETGAPAGDATENEAPETEAPVPESQEPAVQPTVVLEQQADAEYEKWLGAAMVVCVSMEHPDFQLTGIYAASSTSLEDKSASEGAYILFTSGGKAMAIHSRPLEAERTAAGTKDISTQTLGFATFDPVDPASVKTDSMEELKVEDLTELINQSLLISIYTH